MTKRDHEVPPHRNSAQMRRLPETSLGSRQVLLGEGGKKGTRNSHKMKQSCASKNQSALENSPKTEEPLQRNDEPELQHNVAI